jgi:hypothetical protein
LSASLKTCQAARSSVTMPPNEIERFIAASEKDGQHRDGASRFTPTTVTVLEQSRPHTSAHTPAPIQARARVRSPLRNVASTVITDWRRKSSRCSSRARGSVSNTHSTKSSESTRRIGVTRGSLKKSATSGAPSSRISAQTRLIAITTPNTWRRNPVSGVWFCTSTTSRPRSLIR